MTVVRKVLAGLTAAVVAGILLGAFARLMMRMATLAAGHDSHFSLGGSVAIVLAFVIVTVPGAVLAALVSRRGRSALLVVGALFLCGPATAIAAEDLGSLSALSAAQWAGVGAATVGVYAAILALPVLTLRLLAVGRERGTGSRERLAVTSPQG